MPDFKIVSPQGQPVTVFTNATTWGQFKSELSSRINGIDNMTAVLKSTKNSLEHAEADLPLHDDVVYLTSKAVKAGSQINVKAVVEKLRDKFMDAFEEVLEAIEDGEMGEEDDNEDDEVEDEDMREYRRIQRGM